MIVFYTRCKPEGSVDIPYSAYHAWLDQRRKITFSTHKILTYKDFFHNAVLSSKVHLNSASKIEFVHRLNSLGFGKQNWYIYMQTKWDYSIRTIPVQITLRHTFLKRVNYLRVLLRLIPCKSKENMDNAVIMWAIWPVHLKDCFYIFLKNSLIIHEQNSKEIRF